MKPGAHAFCTIHYVLATCTWPLLTKPSCIVDTTFA